MTKAYNLDVQTDMPLLWFLRDKLELTGTRLVAVWDCVGVARCYVDGPSWWRA